MVTDCAPWPPEPDAVETAEPLDDGDAEPPAPLLADDELELELQPATASAAAASAAAA